MPRDLKTVTRRQREREQATAERQRREREYAEQRRKKQARRLSAAIRLIHPDDEE